jgi:hypothetical protein
MNPRDVPDVQPRMKLLPIWMLAMLVACGGGMMRSTDSGITGTVIYGPTCPVEREGAPPCETPYATVLTVSKDGKAVASIRSGNDGRFRVSLPPGVYTLTAKPTGIGGMQPTDVTVRAHAFTEVQVMVDSGIR